MSAQTATGKCNDPDCPACHPFIDLHETTQVLDDEMCPDCRAEMEQVFEDDRARGHELAEILVEARAKHEKTESQDDWDTVIGLAFRAVETGLAIDVILALSGIAVAD